MHTDLEKMLKWTWGERDAIMAKAPQVKNNVQPHMLKHSKNDAVNHIYTHYQKAEKNEVNPKRKNDDVEEKFKRRILEIKRQLPGCTLKIQGNKYVEAQDADDNDVNLMFMKDIRPAFFHFRKERRPASHRVYFNITEHGRLRAFFNLAHRAWTTPGLLNCKVAGPGEPRADSAVFYFDSADAMNYGIQQIYPWVKTHPQYFNVELPKLTKKVQGLQGVSIGLEPPARQLVKVEGRGDNERFAERTVSQSFGTYRAHLIFMALENSERPGMYNWKSKYAYNKFKKRTEKYFQVAGIDVEKPWQHDNSVRGTVNMLPADALKAKIRGVEQQLR